MTRGRRVVGELGRLGAAQRGDHAGEDHGQAVAAGVDDARLAQHRQQLGAAPTDCWPASSARSSTSAISSSWWSASLLARGAAGHVRELGGDAAGHLAHDGEDRALGRLAHGAVGAVGGARHRGADQDRVDELAGARGQLLGGAADQLREDHAAVAARAEQRRAGDGLDDLVAADLVDLALLGEPVELVEHGAQRERHVVPRVAVGDREDVQVVDLVAACLELRERTLDDGAEADEGRDRTRVAVRLGLGDLAGLQAARADVHALGAPASEMRTFWRFGSKRRLVATIEWERLLPNAGPFRSRDRLGHCGEEG